MVASFSQPTHIGSLKRSTTHYELQIPYFDTPGWGTHLENALDEIDALLYSAVGFGGVLGVWENSTGYAVGDRVIDAQSGFVYQCLVAHTSAAADDFADDRTAHPTYWSLFNNQWGFRGAWVTATDYVVGDVVYDNTEYVVAVCVTNHTSGANIRTNDSAKWHFMVDLKTTVQDAEAAATAAGVSETNAAASASAASTSAGNAATSETNAETAASNAATSETNASTSADNAATSEANASNSASEAATSAGNAESSFLSLNARYLGAKIGDPATDNQGEPLINGALYFNSTVLVFRAYDLVTDTWYDAPAINVAAEDVVFDNTGTGLSSTNLQDAMAELAAAGVSDADYGDINVSGGVWTVQASALTSMGITSSAAELNALDGITATVTELNYTDGVTSPIQTQLDAKQALDATLTALAAFNTNGLLVQTAADTFAGRTITVGGNLSISNADGVAGNPSISLASMAQATVKGRASGAGTGTPTDLSATELTAVIGTLGRGEVLTGLGLAINLGSISDDAATSFSINIGATGKIVLWTINEGNKGGLFLARAAATANVTTSLVSVGLTVGYTTGILTGTTSTDGRVTFSAHTNGLIYVENRTGATLPSLTVYILGPT